MKNGKRRFFACPSRGLALARASLRMTGTVALVLFAALVTSSAWGENVKLSTTTAAAVDKFGRVENPGHLFQFELPAELQNARIDLAYLRFRVQADTTQKPQVLLVRPMLAPWVSGLRLSTLPDSAASPFHVNFGRVNLKDGTGEVEVTQAVRAWFEKELSNLGFLVYPSARPAPSLQLRNLPTGGVAELEIFYTVAEVTKK